MRTDGAVRGCAVFHTSVSPLILLFDFVAGDSVTLRRTAAKHEEQNQDELEIGADTGAAACGNFLQDEAGLYQPRLVTFIFMYTNL